jgi:hypothetical protein
MGTQRQARSVPLEAIQATKAIKDLTVIALTPSVRVFVTNRA